MNTAESCVNEDNCDYFQIGVLSSLCFPFLSVYLCFSLVCYPMVFFSGSSGLFRGNQGGNTGNH